MQVQHSAAKMPFSELYSGLLKNCELGYINRQVKDDLELFNYNEKCSFEKYWNVFTLVSRGLILCPSQKSIVAYCFEKFFNYGEMGVTLPDSSFSTSEKADGSLGIIFYHNRWRVATRGSFESDQAKWAEEYLHKNINLIGMDQANTYLTEIIYPLNRVVVKYDFSGLFLLSTYDIEGYEVEVDNMKEYYASLGFRIPKTYHYNSITDILNVAKTLTAQEEGFVVRFDNGYRVKIKGDEYVKIHRVVTNISPLSVWEQEKDCIDIENIIKECPDEFYKEIKDLQLLFRMKFQEEYVNILTYFIKTQHLSNKELGLAEASKYKSFAFTLRKNNSALDEFRIKSKVRNAVFEMFRPDGNIIK